MAIQLRCDLTFARAFHFMATRTHIRSLSSRFLLPRAGLLFRSAVPVRSKVNGGQQRSSPRLGRSQSRRPFRPDRRSGTEQTKPSFRNRALNAGLLMNDHSQSFGNPLSKPTSDQLRRLGTHAKKGVAGYLTEALPLRLSHTFPSRQGSRTIVEAPSTSDPIYASSPLPLQRVATRNMGLPTQSERH